MKLTIDRNKWLRGEGPDHSYLRRPEDGKQCCVGIYLSALGIPDEALNKTACAHVVPAFSEHTEAHWLGELGPIFSKSKLAHFLYLANDDQALSEEEREEKIAKLFAEAGVEVEFTG